MKTSIAGALLLAVAGPVALADNFIASCDPNSVNANGNILTASCRNIAGGFRCSRLDLTRCVKNNYGQLQSDPSGQGPHYADQCFGCSNAKTTTGLLINNPTLLHCQCDSGAGLPRQNWPTAIIDLNTLIDNDNGLLECFGNRAVDC